MSQARAIIEQAAKAAFLSPDMLTGKLQEHHITAARHHAMRRIRETMGWSYGRIGRLFGKTGASVAYACRKGA